MTGPDEYWSEHFCAYRAKLETYRARLYSYAENLEHGRKLIEEGKKHIMPKHSIYLSDSIHERLDLAQDGVEGMSARLSHLVLVALEGMRDNVPALALAEWQCLCDVTNGHYRSHNDTLAAQLESWVFSIADSMPGCDEKWHVNCRVLARKINALPLIQKCAAYEVCRRFWIRSDINALHETCAAMLEAHGARITD